MAADVKTFQCEVIAPQGKIITCQATSVTFPAHDGYMGIWPDHMPMFCGLGLGFMEIQRPSSEQPGGKRLRLLINTGFLLVSHNLLSVAATEAFFFEGMSADKIEQTIEKERRRLETKKFTKHQLWVENRKLALMEKLAGRDSTQDPKLKT
jgi:F-type H+-transporting ATPase subunit epsilon